MTEIVRNPAGCASAVFGPEEGTPTVFKLKACGAWADLDLVNLGPFNMAHQATWERIQAGSDTTETIVRIGQKSANLCVDCDRYKPLAVTPRPSAPIDQLPIEVSVPESSEDGWDLHEDD